MLSVTAFTDRCWHTKLKMKVSTNLVTSLRPQTVLLYYCGHIVMNGDLELACLAGGARKNVATRRARETREERVSPSRALFPLLRPLLPSACYAGLLRAQVTLNIFSRQV